MSKNAVINIRTEKEKKEALEALYGKFGITVSDAVNIFFNVSLMKGGLPFPMTLQGETPNKITLAAMKESEDIINGKKPSKPQSVKDFFKAMGE